MSRRSAQLSFPPRGHGGARPGAGRPRGDRVSHHGREAVLKPAPLHVVWRTRKDVKSLRGKDLFRQLRKSFARCHLKPGFRLTHFSVLGNHLHLLVEADRTAALSLGLQGLGVSLAKRINFRTRRRGPVFEERFFARELRTPTEVARARDYVLRNQERHLARRGLAPLLEIDPCSSAAWSGCEGPTLVAEPRTWLLRIGYRRGRPRELAGAGESRR